MTREAFCEPLVSAFICDLADDERVISNDLFISQRHISLGPFGLLVLVGVTNEEAVQRFPAAIEILDGMAASHPVYSQRRHYMPPRSNTLGSLSSLARRRDGRGGASSAF